MISLGLPLHTHLHFAFVLHFCIFVHYVVSLFWRRRLILIAFARTRTFVDSTTPMTPTGLQTMRDACTYTTCYCLHCTFPACVCIDFTVRACRAQNMRTFVPCVPHWRRACRATFPTLSLLLSLIGFSLSSGRTMFIFACCLHLTSPPAPALRCATCHALPYRPLPLFKTAARCWR